MNINLEKKIIAYIQEMPEHKQIEVLDFVEYLSVKGDEKTWSEFSLSSALRGMEDESSLYSLDDLKESNL